jgi:CheY-like chemotaxis protein
LDVIGLMLEKIGYQVGLAKTGAEAVELFQQAVMTGKPFDAVILDSSIPGSMGGKETLAQLREVQPQVQAIISSGYTNDPVMSDYKKYGFSAALPKPYKIIKLSETLSSILTKRQK